MLERSHTWMALAVAAAGLSMPARAQRPAPAVGERGVTVPAMAAQDTVNAAEDIAVLKALAPLQLTRSQLAQLLPTLQSAQSKLATQENEESQKLAAQRASLEKAKRDVLSGKSSGASAESQLALAQSSAARRLARLRADLVSGLRRTLATVLAPEQSAAMAEVGQSAVFALRNSAWRGGAPAGGGGRGGPGGRGGMTGRLDHIREMSPADFERESRQRADRMGGEGSPRYQQYLTLMNQVRTMPHSQYLLQRDQLAVQSMAGMGGPFGNSMAGNSEEAANAFVDRYLLSPRAPIAIADRLRAP